MILPSPEAEPAQVQQHGRVDNDPAKVTSFVQLFNAVPVHELVGNLSTAVSLFTSAQHVFPLTLNSSRLRANCYICCFSSAYIDYAIDETRNFAAHPWVRMMVRGLIRSCAPIVRLSGLDDQVQVNNWLFSTNPVPRLDDRAAIAIRDTLAGKFPDRAIVIRSLNKIADPQTIAVLAANGFRLLAARQIYIFADRNKAPAMTRDMKRDRTRLRTTRYQQVGNSEISGSDYARCEALYNMLYLDKYTSLNPHYTARYIRDMHQRGILQLAGLRDENGQLVGVTGLFENGTTLTQPIVGYDTSLPISDALYRMLMAMAQDHASAHSLFFNMSAGAANFKKRRGAVPAIEYNAVYVGHLSLVRRLAARVMELVLTGVGIPLLRKFEL